MKRSRKVKRNPSSNELQKLLMTLETEASRDFDYGSPSPNPGYSSKVSFHGHTLQCVILGRRRTSAAVLWYLDGKKTSKGKVIEALSIKSNPSRRAAADEAARRFEAFTGHTATKEFRFRHKPIRTGVAIGKLVGVMYEATRDGRTDKYFHRFKKSSQPLLIANHDGSSFGIVGGRSRFTDRGIVDD